MGTKMTHEQALAEIKLIEDVGLDKWLTHHRNTTQAELSRQLSIAAGKRVRPTTVNSQIKRGHYTPLMLAGVYGLLIGGRI